MLCSCGKWPVLKHARWCNVLRNGSVTCIYDWGYVNSTDIADIIGVIWKISPTKWKKKKKLIETMDHKTWLWRKKSSEKTIVVNEKVNPSIKGTEQEENVEEKAQEMERSMTKLNEKLSSALTECNAKDDLVTKHAKVAEEAIAGWEKAEAEATSFKEELEDALQQRVAAEERISHLDAALKECMQKLRLVREEQEKRIHDAVLKTSREFEKLRSNLEEKIAETNKRLSKQLADNNHMSKVIQVKEKLIADLSEHKSQAEADFNALTVRLDSTEKENSSLKYEVRMLEKELEIRNEEREYNRKSADASHKQHLESVKKIAKLETECQRLRLLVRKRLPGPAAVAKMRTEVECLGRDAAEARRKKSNLAMGGLTVKDCVLDSCHDSSNKRINFLIERLCGMEEENKILKETLTKKNNELQSSRIMCSRTASRLSQLEEQLGDYSKAQTGLELARIMPISYEPTLASISEDGYNEDEGSCAESWASALISELEHFRNAKPKEPSYRTVGASDLSLMDDFVEMERLAIVAVDKPSESSPVSSDGNSRCLIPSETIATVHPSESAGKELVPIGECTFGDLSQESQLKDQFIEKSPSWIQCIWRAILQQSLDAKRSLDEVVEEVRITLMNKNHPVHGESIDMREMSNHSSTSDTSQISGYLSWKQPHTSPRVHSSDGACDMNISTLEMSNCHFCPNLNKLICKIIELIEGINQTSSMDYSNQQFLSENVGSCTVCKESEMLSGYTVRAFQWKSSELNGVLQNFVHICNDLLHGKANLEKFTGELTSTLDWIMNHCFSLQDVSSMKDTIKKHFNWDESRSESDVGVNSPHSETGKVYASEECKHTNIFSPLEKEIEFRLKEENSRLKDKILNLEVGKQGLEQRLQLATNKNETLMTQLQELEQNIECLQIEMAKLKESKGLIEDQIENQKLMNEDLGTQLSVVRVELNDARQKFSSLEVEFEDKNNCCEELEATCLELQLQLESVANKEISNYNVDQEENHLRKEWEISAASEKLAECQETILNLGKQLKALASPRDAALIDKVIASPTSTRTKTSQRHSLLDQMLAEDDAEVKEEVKSPKTKEIICNGDPQKPVHPSAGLLYGQNVSSLHAVNNPMTTTFQTSPVKSAGAFCGGQTAGVSLAIVPKRRGGGGSLWRKLLSRKKRGSSKKMAYTIVG